MECLSINSTIGVFIDSLKVSLNIAHKMFPFFRHSTKDSALLSGSPDAIISLYSIWVML